MAKVMNVGPLKIMIKKRKGFTYLEISISTVILSMIVLSSFYLDSTLANFLDNTKNLSVLTYHNVSMIEEAKEQINNNTITPIYLRNVGNINTKVEIESSTINQNVDSYYIKVTSYMGRTKLVNDCLLIE